MATITCRTFRDVDPKAWTWPSFSPAEIACRGTGKLVVNTEAMDALQRLRDRLGKPMIVTSAYRSPEHNRRVGGASASRHLAGDAFDISMSNHSPDDFERAAREAGFKGFGFYPKSNFMHIDMGSPREWGTRFPATAPMFSPEPKMVEKLASSRTMAGSGLAGAGGTAVIADTVMKMQEADAAMSAGSLLAMAIGVFILAGAGMALYARWDDAGRPLLWRK
jgi:hypothetical protein